MRYLLITQMVNINKNTLRNTLSTLLDILL